MLIVPRPSAGGEQFWTNTWTYQKPRSAVSHKDVFDGALLRRACRPKGHARQNSEVTRALLGLNSQDGENEMARNTFPHSFVCFVCSHCLVPKDFSSSTAKAKLFLLFLRLLTLTMDL